MRRRWFGLMAGLLVASLSLPLLASAQQAPHSYLKLTVGKARSDIEGWGREKDTAAALAYGVRFHPNLDLEVGYINFGKSRYRSGADKLSAKSEALFVAAVGRYPLQQAFSVHGKLGASYHWNDWSGSVGGVSYSDDDSRLAPMVGIGLSWEFMPNWAADADYTYFNDAGKSGGRSANIDLLTVGVKYFF